MIKGNWSRSDLLRLTHLYKENRQCVACRLCYDTGCLKHPRDFVPARDIIIEHHVPMVIVLTRKFPYRHREELFSLGLYELTLAVIDRIPVMDGDYITPYLWTAIWRVMLKHIRRDVIVGEKTDRRRTEKIVHVTDLPDTRQEVEKRFELSDEIVSCCGDPTKRFIMYKLIEGGYTIQDIADEMNRSTATVCRIKQQIENEIYEKMKGTQWTPVKKLKGTFLSY